MHVTTLADAAFIGRVQNGEFGSMLGSLIADEFVDRAIAAGAALMLVFIEKTLEEEATRLVQVDIDWYAPVAVRISEYREIES